MKIAWVYLDKKAAAIKAVKDYRSMDNIIQNYNTARAEEWSRMYPAHSSVVSLAPRSTGTVAPDQERIAEAIDAISALDERYHCAAEFMNWFLPAWSGLDDAERFILSEFYQNSNISRDILISNISCELFLERAQIYRYKDKALEHLALMLYGL